MDLEKIVNKLISLSEEKYVLLKDVLSLTENQTSVIDINDVDGLRLLIDRKQEHIDVIKQLEEQFNGIVEDLKVIYEISSLDELESKCSKVSVLKTRMSMVTDQVKEIIKVDDINREKMQIAKDELQNKMANASNGKRAIKQYGNYSTYTDSYFFDKKIK